MSDPALERDRNDDGELIAIGSIMNDATIELAEVDEDILGYEFSDDIEAAAGGTIGIEVVSAALTNRDFIVLERPVPAR